MWTKTRKRLKMIIILIALIGLVAAYHFGLKPSNYRDWSPDQALLPYAEINDNTAKFYNVRNFKYRSITDHDIAHYDKEYDLDKITSVDYIVVPFGSIGAAHTFLSFGFENGDYLAISVEIRKEKGEEFSGIKGLFRQFELMYVVADENDVIKLRTNYRNNSVYLYPTKSSPESRKKLLIDIISRINTLKKNPEFYNTITSTCTTNIASHVNNIAPNSIPWDISLLFPENSDKMALELGLLDVDESISIKELREKYYISDIAREADDMPNFSELIRER